MELGKDRGVEFVVLWFKSKEKMRARKIFPSCTEIEKILKLMSDGEKNLLDFGD